MTVDFDTETKLFYPKLKMRKVIFLIFTLFLLSVSPIKAEKNLQESSLSTDRLLVKFRRSLSLPERQKFHRRLDNVLLKHIDRLDIDIIDAHGKDIGELLRNYRIDSRVEYVEPDYIAYALESTNDPYLNLQWGMEKVTASGSDLSAWDYSKSNPSVKIAILDTGIDQDHEDLKDKIVANYKCSNSSTVDDLYGHGTHVAGIAGAITNNEIGVTGLGYNASLMNVKVLGDSGSGYYSWIADCIRWAADNGAKVINLSLGGSGRSKTLENAVDYAWGKGVVLVAAAGNSGRSSRTYPAYYKNVMAVAATDKNDRKASWSNYGIWVSVAAPGVSIYSTFPNHSYSIGRSFGYDYASGTSMATPHVAGLAGLVWSTSYGTSNYNVRSRIESKADRISGTGRYWRYGRINAFRSVIGGSSLPSTPTATATPSPTPTLTPTVTPSPKPTSTPSPTLTPTPTDSPEAPSAPTPTPTPWWCKYFPSWCN